MIFADVNTTVEGLEIVGAPEDSFTSVSTTLTSAPSLPHRFLLRFLSLFLSLFPSLPLMAQVSFDVLPAVREVSLECFQYWIIVVSVVAGLLALLILIGALACVSHYACDPCHDCMLYCIMSCDCHMQCEMFVT